MKSYSMIIPAAVSPASRDNREQGIAARAATWPPSTDILRC